MRWILPDVAWLGVISGSTLTGKLCGLKVGGVPNGPESVRYSIADEKEREKSILFSPNSSLRKAKKSYSVSGAELLRESILCFRGSCRICSRVVDSVERGIDADEAVPSF